MLKRLFSTRGHALPTTTTNDAGGRAYAFSPEHALAQYAVTGTVHNTFYATAEDQLSTVLALAGAVSPEFVAKTALYCRTRGFMKDVPALLVAYLAKADVKLMSAVFPAVIDNGKMLRSFVQIVRSGAIGRKSLGTAPKRAARTWFASRAPEVIFRQSTGQSPSMADVVKLVRPSPSLASGEKDTMREALYGYLIGKEVDTGALPANVRAFEAFKAAAAAGQTGADAEANVPDVPFEMLTALSLTKGHWKQIARNMSWTQTRMNLNTLLRNGVLEDEELVRLVAARLANAGSIRRARVFPYQLLAAFRAAGAEMPRAITVALEEALEIATENVPAVAGKLYICPDVSGSMTSSVTGYRKGATSAVRCVDVAGLLAASLLRRNPDAELLAFSDDVVKMPRPLNPRDTVMTNAQYLASLPSGGTACSAPLRHLNAKGAKGDLVVYVSDNQSWADFARSPGATYTRGTAMAEEWERFRTRNPDAKLALIDLQPNATTQVQTRADVLNIGGFSDAVFELLSLFANGRDRPGRGAPGGRDPQPVVDELKPVPWSAEEDGRPRGLVECRRGLHRPNRGLRATNPARIRACLGGPTRSLFILVDRSSRGVAQSGLERSVRNREDAGSNPATPTEEEDRHPVKAPCLRRHGAHAVLDLRSVRPRRRCAARRTYAIGNEERTRVRRPSAVLPRDAKPGR